MIQTRLCFFDQRDINSLSRVIPDFSTRFEDALDAREGCWLCEVGKNLVLHAIDSVDFFDNRQLCSLCRKKVFGIKMSQYIRLNTFIGCLVPQEEKTAFMNYLKGYGLSYGEKRTYPLLYYVNFLRMSAIDQLESEREKRNFNLMKSDYLDSLQIRKNASSLLVSNELIPRKLGEIFGGNANQEKCLLMGGSNENLELNVDSTLASVNNKDNDNKQDNLVNIARFNDSVGKKRTYKRKGYRGRNHGGKLKQRYKRRLENDPGNSDNSNTKSDGDIESTTNASDTNDFIDLTNVWDNLGSGCVDGNVNFNVSKKKRNRKRKKNNSNGADNRVSLEGLTSLNSSSTVPGVVPSRTCAQSVDSDMNLFIDKHGSLIDSSESISSISILDSMVSYSNELSLLVSKFRDECNFYKEMLSTQNLGQQIKRGVVRKGRTSRAVLASVSYLIDVSERFIVPNSDGGSASLMFISNNPSDLLNFGDSSLFSDVFVKKKLTDDTYYIFEIGGELKFFNVNNVPIEIKFLSVSDYQSYLECCTGNFSSVSEKVGVSHLRTFLVMSSDFLRVSYEYSFDDDTKLRFCRLTHNGSLILLGGEKQRMLIKISALSNSYYYGVRVGGSIRYRFGCEKVVDKGYVSDDEFGRTFESLGSFDCDACIGEGCGTALHVCDG